MGKSRVFGIIGHSFCAVYLAWIQHCAKARDTAFVAGRSRGGILMIG